MPGHGYFEALSCLLDGGVGILVGTSDAAGVPRAGRAWGLRMDDDRLRAVIGGDDPALVANLDGRMVAITGAEVRTLRGAQLKGRVLAVVEPDVLDLEAADAQTEAFLTGIEDTDGTPYHLTSRMLPRRMVTIVVDIVEGYDQTPGPGAGQPLLEPA
jgi:hypothetical protein